MLSIILDDGFEAVTSLNLNEYSDLNDNIVGSLASHYGNPSDRWQICIQLFNCIDNVAHWGESQVFSSAGFEELDVESLTWIIPEDQRNEGVKYETSAVVTGGWSLMKKKFGVSNQ